MDVKFSAAEIPTPPALVILGLDPGRDKCGLAVWAAAVTAPEITHSTGNTPGIAPTQGAVLTHAVIAAAETPTTIADWIQKFGVTELVMGNQTTAKQWRSRLTDSLNPCPPITLVDERYSTLEARDRYWAMYPPQGLTRLIPQGLRQPPRPIDDIVAILLIERYLKAQSIATHP